MSKSVHNPILVDREAIFADGRILDEAMAEGVAAAFRRHKAAGVPAYIWRDGHVVEIAPEDLPDHVEPILVPRNRQRPR
ncbi:MAG TPA: hypothetical protein VNU46_00055 [Gemmatimonadaceae bacterium]|nr:hypothetical protein [Gemmatimonadaceae bacterium]